MQDSKPPRRVKVRVAFTLEVDAEAWSNEYGIEETAAAIRKDVNLAVYTGVRDHYESLGLLVEREGA